MINDRSAVGPCIWEGDLQMDDDMPDIGIADPSEDLWDCVGDLLANSDQHALASVVVLPSVRNPRSLIVTQNRRAASRLVWRQFGGGGPRRGLKAMVLTALVLTGLAERNPAWRFGVPIVRPRVGYREWLQRQVPTGTRVGAVLLGPPRANRKPVVLLVNGRGELVAVAKFGVNKVTRPLVRHEADALQQVGDALGDTVHVPRLLASASVGKGEVLLMAPLPVASLGTRPSRAALVEVVRAVGAADRRPGMALREVATHPRLAPLRPLIDKISQSNEAVVRGSFHGDLHPGNLAVAHDGRVVLWDWERWGRGAPVGIDLLHHDLQSWITQEGMAPRDAATALIVESPMILEPLGVSPLSAPAVAKEYLIRLASRYAEDEQDRAGSALGAIEQWLLPAVLD